MATRDYLSYSQITQYQACSLRYYYGYVEQIKPRFTPATLALGSAIHGAIAASNQASLEGDPLSLPDMQSVFDEEWRQALDTTKIRFKKDGPEAAVEQGRGLLAEFHKAGPPTGYTLVAIEEPFGIPLPDGLPPLTGVIDALYLKDDDSKSALVIDYKTSATSYSEDRPTHDLQLTAYSLAMAQDGYPVEKQQVGFTVLVKTKAPKVQTLIASRSARQHDRFVRTVSQIYRAIQTDVFYPSKDFHCADCPFRDLCEAW